MSMKMPAKGPRDNSGAKVENPLAGTSDLPMCTSDTYSKGGSGKIAQANPTGTMREKL